MNGRRRLVCHHEAGHAVVRWWLGHPADDASVIRRAAFLAGATIADRRGRPQRAEGIVNGYDIADPETFRLILAGDAEPGLRLAERFAARVGMALMHDFAGAAAEARYLRRSMATCLIDGGAGDTADAHRLAEDWFDDEGEALRALWAAERHARAFVRSPKGWTAISAVASALHARGELDGIEIAAMCAEIYGGEPAHDGWALRWPPTPEEIRSGFLPQREPAEAPALLTTSGDAGVGERRIHSNPTEPCSTVPRWSPLHRPRPRRSVRQECRRGRGSAATAPPR